MNKNDPIQQSILRIADTVGGLIQSWGFKRPMGRMWTVMYLTPEPMSAADLGERLSMSAGAVSMTLQELQKWGVAKKTWLPGERRDYYEPETSIWKMVSRVFRERELEQIRNTVEILNESIKAVARAGRADPKQKKIGRFVSGRVESLLRLTRAGEALLSGVLDGKRIDPSPIRAFFLG